MSRIRNAVVAGRFYPSDAHELRTLIEDLLLQAESQNVCAAPPKAVIAPHAGYVYSGSIAASAYAVLKPARDTISRVVLMGPAHHVRVRGLVLPDREAFATPLGVIAIDRAAVSALGDLPQVSISEGAHAMEHSLEVHLPFLQTVLRRFQLVPLLAGEASAQQVAAVLDRLWGGPETLIVISSDLSHYHDYETAQCLDRATSAAIEQCAYEDIQIDHACGRVPVSGLLLLASTRGMLGRTIDLRNSGDTAGPRDQVVGYGAYVFHGPDGSPQSKD